MTVLAFRGKNADFRKALREVRKAAMKGQSPNNVWAMVELNRRIAQIERRAWFGGDAA